MQAIVDLVAEYWARIDEGLIVSCLKGHVRLGHDGRQPTGDSFETIAGQSATTRLNGATFVDAARNSGTVLTASHLWPCTQPRKPHWRKLDLIDFIPDSEGRAQLRIFQGGVSSLMTISRPQRDN